MQIATYILAAVGSLMGGLLAWYLKGLAKEFIQRYRSRVQESEILEARKQAQRDNQSANYQSDRMKKIDGR